MTLILYIWLLFAPAYAVPVEWVTLPHSIPVYTRPVEGAPLLTMSTAGEKIAVRQRGALWARVQIKRLGQWKMGYLTVADLDGPGVSTPRGDFGFGAGGLFTYLSHGAKKFMTDDHVEYTTGDFTSTTASPTLVLQYGRESFWRLLLTYRLTDYISDTVTDLPGAQARELSLSHTMFSVAVQKVWTPLAKPILYLGLGLEVSRATSAELEMGGVKLPVADEDLPTYVGGHGVVGVQIDLARPLSAFAEVRALGYFNQTPLVYGVEGAGGLIFWP